MKTRFGMKTVPIQNKQKAKDLLEIIGVIKEIPKEKMALTEEEKIEKIYNEDLKKYKERYISKNKKYESYSKAQKDKFNKDLEEMFKQGFIGTTIINQSLQDKKQKDEMMKKRSLHIIRDEHASLAAMLRSMSQLLERGPEKDPRQFFEVMRAMLFYIDEFPEQLHHPKESN
jgi:hypothetical protein